MPESRRTSRQDYILKVRYRNTLPQPYFAPKLLKLPTSLQKYYPASYISSLIHEQQPKIDIDSELGLPIDVSSSITLYSSLKPLSNERHDPKEFNVIDKALLKPLNDGYMHKSHTEVAFLRRTQYISADISNGAKLRTIRLDKKSTSQSVSEDDNDPSSQLVAIESTFADSQAVAIATEHPLRRGVLATDSWQVVIDADRAPQQYMSTKFPSNPLPRKASTTLVDDDERSLESACLIPRILESDSSEVPSEYISYFLRRPSTADDQQHADTTTSQSYQFVREYDAKREEVTNEWGLIFEGKWARYVHLPSRMSMRGRRRAAQITSSRELVKLELRPLTVAEATAALKTRYRLLGY